MNLFKLVDAKSGRPSLYRFNKIVWQCLLTSTASILMRSGRNELHMIITHEMDKERGKAPIANINARPSIQYSTCITTKGHTKVVWTF
jgi:hypothetical protein